MEYLTMTKEEPGNLTELAQEATVLAAHLERLARTGDPSSALETMLDEGAHPARQGDSPLASWIRMNMPHLYFGVGINSHSNGGWSIEVVVRTERLLPISQVVAIDLTLPQPLAVLEKAHDLGYLHEFMPSWAEQG